MLLVLDHQALRSLPLWGAGAGNTDPTATASVSGKPRRVVVIGNFDGVHRGHQELFARARTLVPPPGQVVALTFWPHPVRVLSPTAAPPLITSRRRKHELLAACGVDVLIEQPFDLRFSALSPTQFVSELLLGSLQADVVCVGYDFNFGKGRSGNAETLRALLTDAGVQALVVPAFAVPLPVATPHEFATPATPAPPSEAATICSSSGIRRAVQEGRLLPAASLLGRPVEVEGEVVHGAARGRTLGYPTANLKPSTDLLPPVGIYAAWAEILGPAGSEPAADTAPAVASEVRVRPVISRHPAAVSVGYNATFTGKSSAMAAGQQPGEAGRDASGGTQNTTWPQLSIEAHLIQPTGATWLDLYGQTLRLSLIARLRDEERFPSVEALCAQIARDIDATKTLLGVKS